MRFNRKQLCALADCHLEQFKNATNGSRPFGDAAGFLTEEKQNSNAGFKKYSLSTVVRLALASEASTELGFAAALWFAANVDLPQNIANFGTPYFVGIAGVLRDDALLMHLSGDWREIAKCLEVDPPQHLRIYELSSVVSRIASRAASLNLQLWPAE